MSLNINLEANDVNTVLEGLARVQDNAARVTFLVREQATVQLQAQQAAAEEAQKAADDAAKADTPAA